jgi:HK97 family phage prohead protease/HK97 family phage major capsid protein
MIRKVATGKLPGTLTYVLSDATRDRYGDVIEPAGWQLDNFKANPIALFSHQSSFPIGNWENVRVEGGKLIADYIPADPGTSERVDEVNSLIRQNVLKATSVGFNPIESTPIDPAKPYDGTRFTRQELLETSIVSVPANPATLQVAKSLNISDDTMSLVFGKHAVTRRRDIPPGVSADQQSLRSRAIPMDNLLTTPVTRQIEDRQLMLNAARDALADLVRDPNHDGAEEDLLNEEIEEHEVALKRLQRTERSLAFRTSEQLPALPGAQAGTVHRTPLGLAHKDISPGQLIARAMAVKAISEITHRSVDDILQERYPDHEVTAVVTRAAIAGATTTTPGWAQELITLGQADFLQVLVPVSVFPRLANLGTALSFGPNQGAIKIPSRAITPSIGGSFVGEGAPIPVRRLGTTAITLYPHKVGGLSVFSREIATYSNPSIEGIIRQAIADDTSINIDALLLDANPVSTTRPAGLTNGVTPVTASAAKGYLAILADIQALTNPFYALNAGRRLAMLINPQQGEQLAFAPGPSGVPFGWTSQFTARFDVIESTSIPMGNVYMIDAVDFVSVAGAPEFEVSEVATLHMEDTAPANIGSAGSPPVVAAPVQSMFQTAQIAIRMLASVTWAMRRPQMVQYLTGANWAP